MNSLLPPNATSLELTIERNIDTRLSALPVNIKHNKNPDLIDAALLDLSAQEFSVDYWDVSWSESKKRNKIKESVEIHRYKGTLYAVKTAIEKITQDYQIIEWFAKPTLSLKLPAVLAIGSGVPNTIEVNLSVSSSVAITKEVMATIESYKPLHVHATVLISQSADAGLSLVAAGYCETHVSVYGLAA